MSTTHKERLNQLITALGLSKNKFAKAIGTSSAVISNVTTADVNYGVELAEKILSTFPRISPGWLLMGKGEMMLAEPDVKPDTNRTTAHEKRHQVFISYSHNDNLKELLAARIDYRGRPAYYYQPEDKIYNYYADLTPEEVEQRIEYQLDELLDVLVDYNFLVEMINERRRTSANYETEYELVTFKKVLDNIEEDGLGENIAPNTKESTQRLIYLFEVEAQLDHWRGAISGQIKRLAGHGFGRNNAYKATYGKEYPYGKYPSAKELVAHQNELAATFSEEPTGEGAELPEAGRN